MSLLYLIRHAESEIQPGVPSARWPLTEAGHLAARVLAGRRFWPEIAHLYTSTEAKAIATVAPAAELWRLPTTALPALDEVHRTFVEGYREAVAAFFERPEAPPSGWESAASARERVVAALEALLASHPGESLALAGHGLLWALLRSHLLGEERVVVEAWRAIRMPDVALWRVGPEGLTLVQDFEGIRSAGS